MGRPTSMRVFRSANNGPGRQAESQGKVGRSRVESIGQHKRALYHRNHGWVKALGGELRKEDSALISADRVESPFDRVV